MSPTATVIAAVIAAFALLGAGLLTSWLTSRIKIAEFRQAWIIDLRKDISDYLGATQKWHRKFVDFQDLPQDEKPEAEKEAFALGNEASVILWRIKMRFNPNGDNPHKDEDDAFLRALETIRNPGSFAPPSVEARWFESAEAVVIQARKILKREWETTKEMYRARWPGQVSEWFKSKIFPPLADKT